MVQLCLLRNPNVSVVAPRCKTLRISWKSALWDKVVDHLELVDNIAAINEVTLPYEVVLDGSNIGNRFLLLMTKIVRLAKKA